MDIKILHKENAVNTNVQSMHKIFFKIWKYLFSFFKNTHELNSHSTIITVANIIWKTSNYDSQNDFQTRYITHIYSGEIISAEHWYNQKTGKIKILF